MNYPQRTLYIPVPVDVARQMFTSPVVDVMAAFAHSNCWDIDNQRFDLIAYDALDQAQESFAYDVRNTTDLAVVRLTYDEVLHERLTGRAGEAYHNLIRSNDRWSLNVTGLEQIVAGLGSELSICPPPLVS